MARSSKYNAARLGPIVASSGSLAEVMRRLGLTPNGGNYRLISTRVRQAGLDINHFRRSTWSARVAAVSAPDLSRLVGECTSVAQLLARLDMPTEGGAHRELSRRLRELALDTSHFRGRGWSRGETKRSHPSVERVSQHNAMTDAQVFVENASAFTGRQIIRRLLGMGWEYRCAWCGIVEWRGKPLVLHLDHINGINNDNRLVNLRILCPNCHSQTPTYGKRRR